LFGITTSHAKHQHKGNMKSTYVVIIAVMVGLAVPLFAAEKQSSSPPASSPGSHETFTSEVLKVFSATDSNAVFRAYLVKWKGQEVVASDPLVTTEYRVGDTATVLAMNLPFPNGKPGPALLAFQITAPVPQRYLPAPPRKAQNLPVPVIP